MRALIRSLFGMVVGSAVARLFGLLGRFHARPAGVTRRGFIRNATLGAVLIVLLEFTAGFLRFFWPNKTGAFGSKLTVAGSDIPPVGAPPLRNTAGKFWLVHNDDGLMALYWKCPHLGCTVPYVGPPESQQAFQCPCHGSMYDYNGILTGGPAPRPMDYMAIEVQPAGDIIVDTGAIKTRGEEYKPEQATPYPA